MFVTHFPEGDHKVFDKRNGRLKKKKPQIPNQSQRRNFKTTKQNVFEFFMDSLRILRHPFTKTNTFPLSFFKQTFPPQKTQDLKKNASKKLTKKNPTRRFFQPKTAHTELTRPSSLIQLDGWRQTTLQVPVRAGWLYTLVHEAYDPEMAIRGSRFRGRGSEWRLEEEDGKDGWLVFSKVFCGDFFWGGRFGFGLGGFGLFLMVNMISSKLWGSVFFFLVSDFWLDDRFHGISSMCQKKGFRKVGVVESLFFVVRVEHRKKDVT